MPPGEKKLLGKSFLERNSCGKWQKPVIYLLPLVEKFIRAACAEVTANIHRCILKFDVCGFGAKQLGKIIQKFTTTKRQKATARKKHRPIHFHEDTMLHCPRIYSGVSGHKVYNAENWSTDSSEEKLSVLKMKIYTRPFSSNVATFVSFDMETLFYDEV